MAIGIIPAGSGNTWAFDLGLEDAEEAARVVAAGETVAVDVMAISSIGEPQRVREYALNIAGFAHAHAHAHTIHTPCPCTCTCHVHAMHMPSCTCRARATRHCRLRDAGSSAHASQRATLARQRSVRAGRATAHPQRADALRRDTHHRAGDLVLSPDALVVSRCRCKKQPASALSTHARVTQLRV